MTRSAQDPRLVEIAKELLNLTIQGSIEWQETDDREAFLYSPSSSSSVIIDTATKRVPKPLWLRVLNQNGVVVESLEVLESAFGEPDATLEMMTNLYNQARRSALKVDATIDSVLRDLRATPPF